MMSEQMTDDFEVDFDDLDNLFDDFDGMAVEGGVDSINDEGCEGGACKL
ncbi:hypothetical protein NGM44_05760 [Moraxella sp. FZFQ2102]|nr:hypothetical protein [Moraxella sp. FZFQ2102]USZ13915.1 hypothetical protein NGM44_05760 [Moraxella sp. FZFQ2102]